MGVSGAKPANQGEESTLISTLAGTQAPSPVAPKRVRFPIPLG